MKEEIQWNEIMKWNEENDNENDNNVMKWNEEMK